MAVHVLRQQLQASRAAPIRFSVGLAQIAIDVFEFGLCTPDCRAVLEPRHRPKPMTAAVLHPRFGIKVQGGIDNVAHIEREAEAGRHDADDGVDATVKARRFPDQVAGTAEVGLPGLIAENSHIVTSRLLLAGQERTAQDGMHAEDIEEIIGGA